MDTINDLLLLYSQAVEYYNGINDDKFSIYQDRIQNMLVRPEILMVMQNASRNPDGQKREEEARKERLDSMAPDELEKLRQEEHAQRKKERAAKMKINNEVQETLKRETDVNYKETMQMFEDTEQKAEVAKGEINKNLASQRTNLKLRLAQRKQQQELKRSGIFYDEMDSSLIKKMPMSTRAGGLMPRFGGFSRGMADEMAYAPSPTRH